MNLRTKAIASASAVLALGLAGAVSAPPAQARWIFHNTILGEKITAPPGGTRFQTCATRLKAVSGFAAYIDVENGGDPATFQIPEYGKTAEDYEVWKAPAGFTSFWYAREDFETGGVFFEDPDGTRHQATLVASVTTPPRTALGTPEPTNGRRNQSGTFVFASAPISVRLTGVSPGDTIGLRPVVIPEFISLTAMDCSLPVLKAKVDLIPGSKANTVHPTDPENLVPVRVFGSKKLRVKKIKEVRLGNARPAAVPMDLKPKLRPKDVNRDGRPDRLYYFRQGDTGMMCIDTSVKVTGRTSNKKYFQAKAPVATAGCDS